MFATIGVVAMRRIFHVLFGMALCLIRCFWRGCWFRHVSSYVLFFLVLMAVITRGLFLCFFAFGMIDDLFISMFLSASPSDKFIDI